MLMLIQKGKAPDSGEKAGHLNVDPDSGKKSANLIVDPDSGEKAGNLNGNPESVKRREIDCSPMINSARGALLTQEHFGVVVVVVAVVVRDGQNLK